MGGTKSVQRRINPLHEPRGKAKSVLGASWGLLVLGWVVLNNMLLDVDLYFPLQLDTVKKDPDEVLKSFDTSFLLITGNGTQLAPWDVKLGFQRLPFIATLNSLTPDGGLVVMAGVEVQNVFPIQYVETLLSGEKEMRSEEEESTARDKWEVS